jgi:TIR domain-containing protein
VVEIFISWSKPTSHRFALALKDWLPEVIQQVNPWVSSEDIDKGQRWAAEVGAKLGSLGQGVLCLTRENLREPWLNFEGGALAKSLDDARVRPILLDLKPAEVTGPLAQFQSTVALNREDMFKFVSSLNDACKVKLDDSRLARAFQRNWDDFSEKVSAIIASADRVDSTPKRSADDMLNELLERVRELQRDKVADMPPPPSDGIPWPIEKGSKEELRPGTNVFVFSKDRSISGILETLSFDKDFRLIAVVRDEQTQKRYRFAASDLSIPPF